MINLSTLSEVSQVTNQVNVSGTVYAISYKRPNGITRNGARATVKIDIGSEHEMNVVSVLFLNRQAEIIHEYVRPGNILAVAGSLVGSPVPNGNGIKIKGDNFQMLAMRKSAQGVAV